LQLKHQLLKLLRKHQLHKMQHLKLSPKQHLLLKAQKTKPIPNPRTHTKELESGLAEKE
jgi:hypothetical protein